MKLFTVFTKVWGLWWVYLCIPLLLMFSTLIQANELDVSLIQKSRLTDDNVYQVGNWQGLQVNYHLDSVYLFAGYEKAQIIPLWGIGDMTLIGGGAGIRHQLTSRISVFGQIGYYIVSHENEGRHTMDLKYGSDASEGLWMYMNHQYNYLAGNEVQYFDEYQIEYDNAFGGTVGISFDQPITKNLGVGFIVSYSSMKISELFRVMKDEWNFDETGVCWEQKINRDYSSLNFGINMNYRF